MSGISGISGVSVLDTLVREGVDQPIIRLTGHGKVEMCRHAFKSGAAEFLENRSTTKRCWKPSKTPCAHRYAPANAATPTRNPATATPCYQKENAKCSASS